MSSRSRVELLVGILAALAIIPRPDTPKCPRKQRRV